jgi:hypothetical protein
VSASAEVSGKHQEGHYRDESVPPAENGALSDTTISRVGEKSGYSKVRVVPLQGADTGAPSQELPALEKAAENAVGGGAASYRKGEEPLHDPGSVCGWVVHPADLGVPLRHRGGEANRSERRRPRRGWVRRGGGRRKGVVDGAAVEN